MSYKKGLWRKFLTLLLSLFIIVSMKQCRPNRGGENSQSSTTGEITYEGKGYEVTFKITNRWSGAFNAIVIVKNTSATTIENWAIGFPMPYEITNVWNGVVKSRQDGLYIIKNIGCNQDIITGESISFGFCAMYDDEFQLPNSFFMPMKEVAVESKDYTAEIKVTSRKKSEYNGELILTNQGSSPIEDWKLEFDFSGKITKLESGIIEDCKNGRYLIKNAGYHSVIQPGESLKIGFLIAGGSGTTILKQVKLTQILVAEDDLKAAYIRNEILDGDSETKQVVTKDMAQCDRKEITKVSVAIKGTKDMKETVSIEDTYGKDTLSSDLVGLVGSPVKIYGNLKLNQAIIQFTYDEKLLGAVNEDDLRIMQYDEENNQYVFMDNESVVDKKNNTVSCFTTHFSTFLVVDKKAWCDVWSNAKTYCRKPLTPFEPTHYFDFCYVIDRSDHIYGIKDEQAKEAIEKFVDGMYSIVSSKVEPELASVANVGSYNFSNNKNYGGNIKTLLLLCDGDLCNSKQTSQREIDKEIRVYPILLNSINGETAILKKTDVTDKCWFITTSQEVQDAMNGICPDHALDMDTKDSDEDGLYDIYETEGMLLPNGKYVYSNPSLKDSDGDGLTDAEEMGVPIEEEEQPKLKQLSFKTNEFGRSICAEYFNYKSDPSKGDTDGDGIPDNEDPLILVKGISTRFPIANKSKLYDRIEEQIKKDYSFKLQYKNIGKNTTKDCLDIILENDQLITDLSNTYLMPKAAIQSVLLRELRCYDYKDDLADIFVMSQFTYHELLETYQASPLWTQAIMGYPSMPTPYKEDSSVGYGQIFAKTAIRASNWARNFYHYKTEKYNFEDWKDRQKVWNRLKNDSAYNILMITLALAWGTSDNIETTLHLNQNFWNYSEQDIIRMLARYNGAGPSAEKYGRVVYHCYQIFELYNM